MVCALPRKGINEFDPHTVHKRLIITIHSLNGSRYLVGPIPEDATEIDMPEQDFGNVIQYKSNKSWHSDTLPSGNYEPPIHAKSITEEQAAGMVGEENKNGKWFIDFTNKDLIPHLDAIESLHSWLTSIGHTTNSVIIKVKP